AALDPVLFSDYDQLRRFFYLFLFRDPAGVAEAVVAADGMAFIDRLWAGWSPGYHPGEHLSRVKESLRRPANPTPPPRHHPAPGRPAPRAPRAHGGLARTGRPGRGRPAAGPRNPPSPCTGPMTAASQQPWPAAPSPSSPHPLA